METAEKKVPVKNLERVKSTKLKTYQEADQYRTASLKALKETPNPPAKVKVFARNDGTFDVVWYKRVDEKPVVGAKIVQTIEETVDRKKKRYTQPK